MNLVELEARRVRFYSANDEKAFFDWLDRLDCLKEYEGRGDAIYLSIAHETVDEEQLRELLSLFRRYDIDMKQLKVFDVAKFKEWFKDPRAYWFAPIFGS